MSAALISGLCSTRKRATEKHKTITIMAFYKKTKNPSNNKWYPRTVTVEKPVTTDEIADKLSLISTVSRADTYAVLKNLANVMADEMRHGLTVKLEGLGTFYYSLTARGNGVDTPEEVSAKQIAGTRVRFIPEVDKSDGKVTRAMVNKVTWTEWGAGAESSAASSGSGESTGGETGGGTSGGSEEDIPGI